MNGRAFLLAGAAASGLALAWHFLGPRPPVLASTAVEEPGGVRRGRFRSKPPAVAPELEAELEALNGIGYASGSEPAPARTSVTVHARERVFAGTNLYTSGHAPVAVLMDMDGRELHTWRADVEDVWPQEELPRSLRRLQFWRRVHLYENGDLLAIFEGHSLIKLDKHSNLLWKSRCHSHHDLEVLPNGDILVLTRLAHFVPGFAGLSLEDFVTVLDSDGNEKRSFSLLDALETPGTAALLERARGRKADILHANTVARLDGRLAARLPAFREGNLLVSSRPLSFLAVVDPEREEVVWTMQGRFREQHDPKVLENGNLLVFDNRGLGEASSVLELDPVSGETVWEYRGTAEAPFYTETCGAAERLPNGNTLITESDSGRAFEVTPTGEIVWEFWNPARAGEADEYIATLFELLRFPPEHRFDWLGPR